MVTPLPMVTMLKVFPVGPDRSGYFATGPPGHWDGRAATRLELGIACDLSDLRGLLSGRHPGSAARLAGLGGGRSRAGHELIVAAPKSISLLATLGGDGRTGIVARAHHDAVADVIAYLERHAAATRWQNRVVRADGLVVASFSHRRNAAGEPHLHTHSVIPNVAPTHGEWRCLYAPAIWEHRRAASALYFMAMEAHLRAGGLHLQWRRGPGGFPEVAGVPRAAIEAASSRSAEVLAAATNRTGRGSGPGTRRGDPDLARKRTHNRRPDARWPAAVAAAGFDRRRATAIFDAASERSTSAIRTLNFEAVEGDLLARGSQFRASDAMEVVARAAPPGTTLQLAEEWAEQVCARARSVNGRRFLSPSAELADERVTHRALGRRATGAGVAVTTLDIARWTAPALDPRAEAALQRLVTAGHGVEVLGPGAAGPDEPPVLAQAAVIDAARVAWQASGQRVAVLAAPRRQAQWRALTALDPHLPGASYPSVLVVDRAERMATPELAALLEDAARAATKVVLVEGGTAPSRARPRSEAFAEIAERHGRIDPGRAPAVEAVRHHVLSRDGERTAALSGSDAMAHLFQSWVDQPRAMMVAEGMSETVALNAAARRHLVQIGVLRGPEIAFDGAVLREGDRVRALTRGAGALGTVVALHAYAATVRWDSGLQATLGARAAGGLGHGYAAPPGFANRVDTALLALGDSDRLALPTTKVAAVWVIAPTRTRDLGDFDNRAGRGGPARATLADAARGDLEATLDTRRSLEADVAQRRLPPAGGPVADPDRRYPLEAGLGR